MTFYQTPEHVFNPIAERRICEGRVVLPLAGSDVLYESLTREGVTDIIKADDEDCYLDPQWWKSLDEFDWCVAVTQGFGKTVDWVIEPGYELAKKGLIILDRLTFLEPTRTRENFLTTKRLSNLIVLNPRPIFRADQKKSKDSVTSAWFVFRKDDHTNKETKVEYAVSWQRPRSFA